MIPEFMKKEKSLVFNEKMRKKLKGRHIIVERVKYETYINNKGEEVKRRIITRHDITSKINEMKKLLQKDNAIVKLQEMDKISEVKR